MGRTLSKPAGGSLAPWLGVALIVILFDQLSKIAIAKVFAYGQSVALAPFFNLVLVYNRGAAFSFLAAAGGWQRWAFTALGVIAVITVAIATYCAYRLSERERGLRSREGIIA